MSPCHRLFEFPSRFGLRCLVSFAACALLLAAVGCEQEHPLPTVSPATASGEAAEAVSNDESEANVASSQDDSDVNDSDVNDSDVNDSDAATSEAPEGKVLRHAVFFSFKEDSTPEDIQKVVDAFAALPGKISEIVDLQYGTNNSTEGLDDGFTHCFLLTFKDEAGRAAYLPHPAHSGEFADVLRPHMKDVFVIDYWGTPPTQKVEKELKHAVFFKFNEDASQDDIHKIEQAFAELPSKIDAIKAFEWGINNSPEKHDDGFTHCFMVTFDSEEGREAYLPNPEHKAFVEVLMPVLDKVRVLDFWEN